MKFSKISILEKLKERYSQYLRTDIIDVFIVQSKESVELEIISIEILEDGLEKETICTDDLDFITEDDGQLFLDPNKPIEVNARKFINELSPYSIINTTDLFTEEAAEKIFKKYNVLGIDR